MIKWRFPSNDNGENKGINDSGTSLFKGKPLESLAREICQNSLDAANKNKVVIEFDLFNLKTNNIPEVASLRDAFNRCLNFWNTEKGSKTKEHFVDALKTINNEYTPVLRVSDFNTTGLTGSTELKNSNWINLTKSSGVSDKDSTSGGSFGIGKFAPFACSSLSTVFYSTYDCQGVEAYQGVARLVTFEREDNETTTGLGYYGNYKNTPVTSQLNLDPGFKRKNLEFGTDIYILGYKFVYEWEKKIIVSILKDFFVAIWREQLDVNVGEIKITKNNLQKLMLQYQHDFSDATYFYFEALTSPDTKWSNEELLDYGEIEVGLLFGQDEYPNKICMVRKSGMKIKEQGNLNSPIKVAGIMLFNGNIINSKLKEMENPEHTKWEPDRASNQLEAREILKSINSLIRRTIDNIIDNDIKTSVDAAGVGQYIPDLDEDSDDVLLSETIGSKIKNTEIKKIKSSNTINNRTNIVSNNEIKDYFELDESGSELVDIDESSKDFSNSNTKIKDISDEKDSGNSLKEGNLNTANKNHALSHEKIVLVCVDKVNGKYVLLITPSDNADNVYIELFLSAETTIYEAPLISASYMQNVLHHERNIIKGLRFEKGKQIRLTVELDYNEYCSMEVKIYAIKK